MTTPDAARQLRESFERIRNMEGSLAERLDALSKSGREFAPTFTAAVDRLVTHLAQVGAGENAPRVGERMPPFLLPSDDGALVSLEALLEKSPVAVIFHRGHWCPFCRISIHALAVAQRALQKSGQIVAIMPDRQQYAAEAKSDGKAPFPILTDIDNGYAMSLNLVVWVGDEMTRMMQGQGRVLPAYQGNETWTLPIPATFVVDRSGIISARFVDPDFRRRMAIEDLLGEMRAAS
jgi:peroxiredoxin